MDLFNYLTLWFDEFLFEFKFRAERVVIKFTQPFEHQNKMTNEEIIKDEKAFKENDLENEQIKGIE